MDDLQAHAFDNCRDRNIPDRRLFTDLSPIGDLYLEKNASIHHLSGRRAAQAQRR